MDVRKKRAALHNLGCKVNAYETEAMGQLLEANGYEIVPFEEEADVYLINTCSVTNMADRKSRQMLHRARKKNPKAVIVAAGCYVQASAEEILKNGDADLIIGNNQKNRLPELLAAYRKEEGAWESVIDIAHTKEYEELTLEKTAEHTRAFIKIQDGCNQFCSYCIIPFTRGRIRSRKPEDIQNELVRLAQAGYREAVLTGIHLSSYGKDFEEPVSLLDIIRLASGVDGIERIRLGSLEPRIVTEEFVREISAMKKVCPHFHLSLQSGCDATLRRMNRHYTTEEYARCCGLLRKYYSHPAITTDVIVGFPGETEEEFCETMTFLKKIGFYEMHVFKYSRRQGTKAAAMADQVPEELKTERSRIALSLEAELSADFRRYYTGKTEAILLEEVHETETGSFMTGFTREYVKAAIRVTEENKAALVPGQLVKGRFTDSLVTAGGEALEAVLAKKEEGSLCS
ncbi:tRNA (N(6)-L-threonylcarbamoyladenosine(37)-C(2))-methylthiotransferase MtaB [Fusibacillus kribbianus]|uniref:Threonylcarbamoyladenosine tRNA methylthiotransferase MtaB n=1 Tax=Fusibacillus kribbianus TaxID=3044208 RepID=A0AAP4B927_9FIRM|nr:tRNA (N(6)-L-threonylcarbamoyladenosine(37)-C(2))-methylthiotransferase MtaB [Ruminococcus sp. YH-rum2234]MDI9242281.1 tRNA (N(6)-L-threonylcarbamoyladenosine(37)-C(2))-methylthiotransferase MtaB [Ruminococcus sp. YH-rum2234]